MTTTSSRCTRIQRVSWQTKSVFRNSRTYSYISPAYFIRCAATAVKHNSTCAHIKAQPPM